MPSAESFPSLPRVVAILGGGLLGGSAALALQGSAGTRAIVWARREEVCETARGLGLEATTDLGEAVREADLVLLCTPVGVMPSLLLEILKRGLPAHALITDVGSVKADIVTELESIAREAGRIFISSHPMAGSERTGIEAAREDLFQNAKCLITPTAASAGEESAIALIERFWQALGCQTVRLDPAEHDAHMARISHMPHLLSAALVRATLETHPESGALAAGGFRDMSRIAAGSPSMWTEILRQNRTETASALRNLIEEATKCVRLLEEDRGDELLDYLSKARHLREAYHPPQTTTPS